MLGAILYFSFIKSGSTHASLAVVTLKIWAHRNDCLYGASMPRDTDLGGLELPCSHTFPVPRGVSVLVPKGFLDGG